MNCWSLKSLYTITGLCLLLCGLISRRRSNRSPRPAFPQVRGRSFPSSLQLVPVTRIENFSWRTGIAQGMKNSEKSNLYKLESDGTFATKRRRFTNTALPVFSGAECWFQHFHIEQAIVKSNGWPKETAALQLFAHLKGEALNVALLLTREKRESWTGLVSGLSAYYQSPGRLAVLRRRFESAFRRPGLDPAWTRLRLQLS